MSAMSRAIRLSRGITDRPVSRRWSISDEPNASASIAAHSIAACTASPSWLTLPAGEEIGPEEHGREGRVERGIDQRHRRNVVDQPEPGEAEIEREQEELDRRRGGGEKVEG